MNTFDRVITIVIEILLCGAAATAIALGMSLTCLILKTVGMLL